jgi:hypothetical protein
MTIRRAADADRTPWLGILFFIPGLNYILMIALSLLPTASEVSWLRREHQYGKVLKFSPFSMVMLWAILGAICAFFFTNFLKQYSVSLFIASPLILGIAQGYWLNQNSPIGFKRTAIPVAITILVIHLLLLLFALEGVFCLAMSFPIAAAAAIIGASLGAGIARFSNPKTMSPAVLFLVLPILPIVEPHVIATHQDFVLSTIVIDAPPSQVWPNVVKFTELPPPTEWIFKAGVAHPVRARIDGTGVGAVRRCEFSTGAFVEPITTWQEPSLLAFNVLEQPAPMKELSMYDRVNAPHLHGYFRSLRGEFRLIPTTDGKTHLEGRTWYEMDIQPGWYWQIYGRLVIHRIHMRVLNHIKNLSEKV